MNTLLKAKNHAWELSGTNVRTPRRFRDSAATVTDFCESLWTRSPCSECVRSGPDVRSSGTSAELSARSRDLRGARALKLSKVEAVVPRQGLERRLGSGAEMLDHFGGCQRPKPRRVAILGAAREPHQKTRGEQIAGAGSVDHALHGARRNSVGFLARHDQTTPFAARDHRKPRILAQRIERGVEVGGLIQAVQFAFVGENEVDGAGADEIEEFRAITVDAERIRQGQRDVAVGVMRNLRRLEEGLLGVRRIPEVTLEIDDLSGRNGIGVDVVR